MPKLIIDEGYIRQFLQERGAVLTRLQGARLFFPCVSCGGETSIYSIHHIKTVETQTEGKYSFHCKVCHIKISQQKRLEKMKEVYEGKFIRKEQELQELFKKEGSELISRYKGLNQSVTLRCKKCGEIDTFSSLCRVLSLTERFLCRNCQYKRRAQVSGFLQRKYTKEEISQKLNEVGSELLSFTNSGKRPFTATCILCKTGVFKAPSTKKFFNNKQYRYVICKKCLGRYLHPPVITEELAKEWFATKGSVLLKFRGNSERVDFSCSKCGGKGTYYTFAALRNNNPECLCAECNFNNRCGVFAHRYNSKLTESDRVKYREKIRILNPLYQDWLRDVKKSHKGCCAITGLPVAKGHRHHLFSWKRFETLRFCVWNGVYLSPKEHYLFHIRYGVQKFTYQDFKDYFRERTGKEYINVEAEGFFQTGSPSF